MNKEDLKARILNEIEDVEYRYYVLPHSGLLPDYFIHYWDLAEMVSKYLSLIHI